MHRDDLISMLDNLIETSKDGEEGFRACADNVNNPALKAFFEQKAQRCRDGAVQLQHIVREMGGDPERTGSTAGAMHRFWVNIRGTLSGTPAAPALQASDVLVVPGRLADAQVVSADEGTSSFATTGGTLLAPFGGMVFPGPTNVTIQPGAVFLGDATSEAEFFALFAGLEAGEVLAVEVHGIGTGVPNEIGAYQLRVLVQ